MMYVQAGCPLKDNSIYSAIAVKTDYTNHNQSAISQYL